MINNIDFLKSFSALSILGRWPPWHWNSSVPPWVLRAERQTGSLAVSLCSPARPKPDSWSTWIPPSHHFLVENNSDESILMSSSGQTKVLIKEPFNSRLIFKLENKFPAAVKLCSFLSICWKQRFCLQNYWFFNLLSLTVLGIICKNPTSPTADINHLFLSVWSFCDQKAESYLFRSEKRN